MTRIDFTFVVAMLILALTTYNAIDDALEDGRDEYFYTAVLKFMAAGDRNTAAMGYSLCMTQNKHSERLNTPPADCCTIYFPKERNCK